MNRFTCRPFRALTTLIVAASFVSETRAGEFDLWDLTGTDLVGNTSSGGVEDDIWDLLGSGVAGNQSSVEFKEFGIVLSVTPTVSESKERAEPLFVLFSDETWFNFGTERNPRWEPISEDEFQLLIAALEKQDFGLIADVYEDGALILHFAPI
ncbi:MAG: hypothetical protein KDA93_23835 [Planctomycetaceae bacterium]|nr:hypothetical protein [Planctomycetaceae bacterium]